MNLSKRLPRRTVVAVLFHALFLIIVYILQGLVFPFITALQTIPLLLPIAAVGAAMFEGGTRGAVMGLFAGALCDLSMAHPVARFALLLTVVCLMIGVLANTIVARGFLPYLMLSILTLAVCAFAQMFELLFFEGVALRVLLREAGQQTLISLPFCVVLYPVSRAMDRPNDT